jgi:hypothetical protein
VPFEVRHQLAHRLLCHLRPLGEHAHAAAGVVEELEDVAVRDAHVSVPGLGEPVVDVLGYRRS